MNLSSTTVETESISEFSTMLRRVFSALDAADIVSALVLFLLCYAASRLLQRLFRRTLERSRLSQNLQSFFRQTLRFTLDFIIVLIVADSLGIPVSSLLAVFSLFGLALSLSLQNLLGNLISGVMLLFNRPFDVGDYVEIGSVSGTVKQVALFQTQLDTVENKLVYIPNSDVLSSVIVNCSGETTRRVDVTFFVAYTVPQHEVEQAARGFLAAVPQALSQPAAQIVVSDFGKSNVQYTVRFWTRSDSCVAARDAMNAQILQYYQSHEGTFSYPRVAVEN